MPVAASSGGVLPLWFGRLKNEAMFRDQAASVAPSSLLHREMPPRRIRQSGEQSMRAVAAFWQRVAAPPSSSGIMSISIPPCREIRRRLLRYAGALMLYAHDFSKFHTALMSAAGAS